jgi:S-formylglutathione hydrolase FrmB
VTAGRRLLPIVALAIAALTLGTASRASAARIVTWDGPGVSKSRYVDPAKAPADDYEEPPGVPPRPNALKMTVYEPTGYRSHPNRRYPILWLLHGHGDAYDSWTNAQRGRFPDPVRGFPGLIVMPTGDHGWYTNWWNGGLRGDPAWERYHLDQLIPLVDHRLRVRRGRRWHAVAGLSMGGEGAMYYASQRPGYFGTAASFSGTLDIERPEYQQAFDAANHDPSQDIWGDPQAQEFYWAGHNPIKLVEALRDTRLYVSVGDGVPDPTSQDEVSNYFGQLAEAEIHQQDSDFVSAAQNAGIDVTYNQHQGIHDWPYWRRDIPNAIDWGLFKAPPRTHRQWTYDTVATVGKAWRIHFRFDDLPAEVETFSRDGGKLSGRGSGDVELWTRDGCHVRAALPFDMNLPLRGDC